MECCNYVILPLYGSSSGHWAKGQYGSKKQLQSLFRRNGPGDVSIGMQKEI